MISGSSTKEFVLITLDEYMSLLSLKTTKSEIAKSDIANLSESFPQAILPNVDKRTSCEQQETNAEKTCTQINLNSRLQAPPKRSAPADEDISDKAKTLAKTDRIVLDLLSSGLSGGKVERSRQILQKIDQTKDVSIDSNSGRLLMHDRDVNIPIFDFLNDLQVTTKKLSENALELIRRIRIPEFLIANTNAKRVASEIAHYHEENDLDEKIGSSSTAKWLRLY